VKRSMARGRAASPIRPGLFIREQLLEEELNPAEIHSRLRQLVRDVNQQRLRTQRIRPPTWASFYRYFRHLVYFFLVEPTGRTEPVLIAPEALLHISGGNVVVARRAFYRLTSGGRREPPHQAFVNPVGLWKEIGYPPTFVEVPSEEALPTAPLVPPEVPPEEVPVIAPRRRRPATAERLKAEANAFLPEILRHMELISQHQPDRPGLDDLITRMGAHYDRVEEAYSRSRGPRREELLELRDTLERTEAYFTALDDALDAEDWEGALQALAQVSNCCRWPQ